MLRAIEREPETLDACLAEIELAPADERHGNVGRALRQELALPLVSRERRARILVELLALALQGSLVLRHSPPEVAEAFCSTRLTGSRIYGTIPADADLAGIVERHRPRLAV